MLIVNVHNKNQIPQEFSFKLSCIVYINHNNVQKKKNIYLPMNNFRCKNGSLYISSKQNIGGKYSKLYNRNRIKKRVCDGTKLNGQLELFYTVRYSLVDVKSSGRRTQGRVTFLWIFNKDNIEITFTYMRICIIICETWCTY